MTAKRATTAEDQRLGCRVGGAFTREEMQKRASEAAFAPKLEVVKEDE